MSNMENVHGNAPAPLVLLPEGVSQPTWILQKQLTKSDVSSQQSRLLLSHDKVMNKRLWDLITSDEATSVFNRKDGLGVRVFDRLGFEHAMKFKLLKSTGPFRLIGDWNRFVKRNKLLADEHINIWAFRCSSGGLGMALLRDDDHDVELHAAKSLVLLQNSGD